MTTRILIGDDNEQLGKSLARALKSKRYETDLTTTPQETIARARAGNYAAVITDLEYTEGGREGYEVLRQIRDLPALKILFTGIRGFEFEIEAYANGADFAVLNKDDSQLIKLLEDNLPQGRK